MKTIKSILNNLLFSFLSRGFLLFVKILTTFLLAKFFDSSEFGLYIYSITLVLFFEILCGFGIYPLFYKRISQNQSKYIFFNALLLCAISSVLIFILLQIYLYFNSNSNYFILIASFSLLINPFIFLFEKLFIANLRSSIVSLINIIISIILFSLKFYLLALDFPLVTFVYFYVIDAFILLLIYLFLAFKFNLFVDSYLYLKTTYIKKIVSKSFPNLISAIAIIFYIRIDILMLEKLMGDFEVISQYSLSANITNGFAYIIASLGSITVPYFLKRNKNSISINNKFSFLFLISFLFSLIIIIFILSFSNQIISYVFSNKYPNFYSYLSLLIFCLPFISIGGLSAQLATVKNLENIIMFNTTFAALLNIVLNYIFIPHFGVYAAIVSSIFCYCYAAYLGYFFHKDGKQIFMTITKIFNINTTKSLLNAISK